MFLQTDRLTVTYLDDEKPVLRDVSLQIQATERVLLLGPSGAGKSTLLLALAGLVPRAVEARISGEVYLDGRPVTQWTPAEVAVRLGFVFQEPDSQFCMLYPEDEIGFGLENLQLDPKAMPSIIANAFKTVGLSEAAQQTRIDQLSGGQQQRLALAAVLAQDPAMLLLDEPTALLDPQGRRQVVESVQSLAEAGKGLIVVEHLLDAWLDVLERVVVLNASGEVMADDIPQVVFSRHRTTLEALGVWLPRRYSAARNSRSKGRHVKSGSSVLSLHNVSAAYRDGQTVLHEINLEVKKGEFWALVGPNGSGKSTLAKTLIRMVQPIKGEVTLQGKPVHTMRTRELTQQIAYVFQNPEHQFVTDTVWSELNYSLKQAGVPDNRRADAIRNALNQFGLQALAANNPFALSGGQKRRLAVAAMLQGKAPLLVLDEPTFGQDRHHAQELMKTIARLNGEGVAILMLTHDMDLVDEYAEKVAVLHHGRLVYAGTVDHLWEQPEQLPRWGLELPSRLAHFTHRNERPMPGGVWRVVQH